jgi:hypothetical protein
MIKDGMSILDRVLFGVRKEFADMLNLDMPVKVNCHLQLFGPDGKLKEERHIHNQVQLDGKYDAAEQLLASPGKAKAAWMEVGTGSGQPNTSGTILASYISGSRTACSPATARALGVVTYQCTFGAGVGTGAITEIGLFNVVTQNTADMWLYSSFSVINKGANDSLAVTWTLTYS